MQIRPSSPPLDLSPPTITSNPSPPASSQQTHGLPSTPGPANAPTTNTDNNNTTTTTTATGPQPLPLRIITHNIRYAAPYFSRFPHEPPWTPTRHALLTRQLNFLVRPHFTPPTTVIFLQEALWSQFTDVATSLGSDWVGRGVGRDDGKQRGEVEGVFYRGGCWREVVFETRWLNETGEVGRKGWDAASVRTVSVLVLKEVGSGRRVLFMNAHLDDQGAISRREGAKLLLGILGEMKKRFDLGYWIVGGDFNSPVSDDAYEVMVGKGSGLVDVGRCVRGEGVWGEESTYTGFDGRGEGHPEEVRRIDFLFVPDWSVQSTGLDDVREESEGHSLHETHEQGGNGAVQGYAVMPNTFEDAREGRVSDHRAVVVDLLVP